MERLTKRAKNGVAIYATPSGEPVKWQNNRHNVLQRLAMYEDTELTPEQVQQYQKLEQHLCDLFGGELSLQTVVADLEFALAEPGKDNPTKARILTYEDADRYDSYKAAEEEGRMIILPCEVGDTVYVIGVLGNMKPEEYKVIRVDYKRRSSGDSKYIYCEALLIEDPRSIIAFHDNDFNKNIFLTRAEAEERLKELEGEQ